MKSFYKYYYVFLITFIISCILIGGYKAVADVNKAISENDKVMVKAGDILKSDINRDNNKTSETDVRKGTTQNRANNEVNNIDNIDKNSKNIKQEKNNNTSANETVTVFKVNKNDIANQYSSLEKIELLSIMKIKLDEAQYKKIESLLYSNEDDFYTLNKINNILEASLDEKDYDKVLKLASRVVNIDLFNKQ